MNNSFTEESNTQLVKILYTNHRGETTHRTIKPYRVWFGNTQWHQSNQWLMEALDVERDVVRDFAMKDIHAWLPE